MKSIAICILAALFSTAFSFAQGVELDDFSVVQHEQEVFLKWVIARGNSCNGIRIERSADNIHFEEIHYIPGVCGSADFAQPFSFTDSDPLLNQTSYYRLELGLQGYSPTREITIYNFGDEPMQIFPNPARTTVNIRFANPHSRQHDLELISINGAIVHQIETQNQEIELDVTSFPAGIYFARLTLSAENEVVATQRVVVVRP